MKLNTRLISSLEKVFSDEELRAAPFSSASAAAGEVSSFQLAVQSLTPDPWFQDRLCYAELTLRADCESALPVELRRVVEMPVRVPAMLEEPNLLRNKPGLYPDYLQPLGEDRCFRIPGKWWQSLWVTVRVPEGCRPGCYPVTVSLENAANDRTANRERVETTFSLEVLPICLEPQKLLCYEWFHCDCLYTYYKVPCWSDEHWRIMENFIRNGVVHGLNVLLTPLWTIPLDTRPGGERPTAQLLEIRRRGTVYQFGFEKLERFLEMGKRLGISHFAMSHAFTQWGAEATPKILAEVDGKERRIFGWDVPGDDPRYADFLKQLMPCLIAVIKKHHLEDHVFFSVSDEPTEEHLAGYTRASALLESVIGDMPTLEALSSFDFFRRGLVRRPIPGCDHIEPFVGQVSELWTYYCVAQEDRVPNRFFAMPSARNRIMGVLFYLYDIAGFLQWGFNFYYSLLSMEEIDPFIDPCAGYWVPAGDPFIVYPGAGGIAHDSLRHEVFHEAIQDLRALRSLEKGIGREAVLALVHDGLSSPISMTDYPRSADWLLQLRERVNRRLVQAQGRCSDPKTGA